MSRPRSASRRLGAAALAAMFVTPLVPLPAGAAAATALPRAGVVVGPEPVKPGASARVGVVSVQVDEDSRVQSTGWVSVSNTGKKPAVVTVHEVEIVGPDVPADIVGPDRTAVVGPGQTSVLPVGIVGPDHPAGSWVTTALDVTSTGPVGISAGTLSVLGLPTVGSPLPYSSVATDTEMPVGADSALLLGTKIDPSATVDALGRGWVAFRTSARKSSSVTVDYRMDGKSMGSVSGIVGPDRPLVIPVGLLCNGVSAAAHTFEVWASAGGSGVAATAGTLGVVGLPTTGEMPHASAAVSSDAPVQLAAKAGQVMHAELVATGTKNDVWMGGWATIANSSSKAAVVTLQAQMGADIEGPALVVSVAARTTLSVPFGIQCNGEPNGLTSLDLTGTSTAPVTVVAGELQAWSLG